LPLIPVRIAIHRPIAWILRELRIEPDEQRAVRPRVVGSEACGSSRGESSSACIDRSEFWKFGLIFGVVFFTGLLVIVFPWLQIVR